MTVLSLMDLFLYYFLEQSVVMGRWCTNFVLVAEIMFELKISFTRVFNTNEQDVRFLAPMTSRDTMGWVRLDRNIIIVFLEIVRH